MRVVRILILLLFASVASTARAGTEVVLRERVEVSAANVRVMDLAALPIEADLGRQIVFAAPAPGRSRTLTRATLQREFVRAGIRPMPRLKGASAVEIVRPGRQLAPDLLTQRLRNLFDEVDLPPGSLAQRIEFVRVPSLNVSPGGVQLELDDLLPTVGRKSVAVRLRDSAGRTRRFFVTLDRSLKIPVVRALRAMDGGVAVDAAVAMVDTVWVDRTRDYERRLLAEELDGRFTLQKGIAAGDAIRRHEVRATPVVHRGERVTWTVQRNGLHVTLEARSRGDGAIGDWILVESPFDGQLRRVCVIGPALVADHPPRRAPSNSNVHGSELADDARASKGMP